MQRFLGGVAGEGRLQGKNIVERAAQREDVGARVDLVDPAGGLFGRHEMRRSQHRAVHGLKGARQHARRFNGCIGGRGGAGFAKGFGETPVHDEHFTEVPDHDVFGFEVAMDDALGMGE